MTERTSKTLVNMLSMYVDTEHSNWDKVLPFFTFAYNTSFHSVTGFTPFCLLYARAPATTLDTVFPYHNDSGCDTMLHGISLGAEEAQQLARIHSLQSQYMNRHYYNQHHQDVQYNPGSLGLHLCPQERTE